MSETSPHTPQRTSLLVRFAFWGGREAPPRRHVGLGAAMLFGFACLFALAVGWGPRTHTEGRVYVRLDNAQGLRLGDPVRVRGVTIGQVEERRVADGEARITCALNTATPLFADASARLRPKTVLGGRYLDLDPGSGPAPLAAERVIPGENAVLDPLNVVEQIGPILTPRDTDLLASAEEVAATWGPLYHRAVPLAEKAAALRSRLDTLAAHGEWRRVAQEARRLPLAHAAQTADALGQTGARIQAALGAWHAPSAAVQAKLERFVSLSTALLERAARQQELLDKLDRVLQNVSRFDELFMRRLLQEEGLPGVSHAKGE